MNAVYLYLLLGALVIPLLYTIVRKDLIVNWGNFIISTSLIAFIFLSWDAIFTQYDVWGFNPNYCLGIYFLGMPLEEWLFFFIIPFCSLFAHFAIFWGFPNLGLKKGVTLLISITLIVLSFLLIITNLEKAYTVVNFSFLAIILFIGIYFQIELLSKFYSSFLAILIPFFIVNGILTGAVTDNPIVWYNNYENLGIRLFTIPIEDIGYAFSMLFGNLMLFEIMNKGKIKLT